MFIGVAELIAASQQADLKKEEERHAVEKAKRDLLRAQSRAPGQYNTTELLEKMYGIPTEGGDANKILKPKMEKENKDGNAQRLAKFPPPARKAT